MAEKSNDTEMIIEGTVWKTGDNVNTESITPTRWLHEGHDLLMEHIGEVLIPEFPQKCQKNDVWVGGSNHGCSSSRNAPQFLKDKGIGVVICHSATRIFYRNAINAGLPIFDIGKEVNKLNMGERVRVNVNTAEITNLTTGAEIKATVFPDFIMAIVAAGNLHNHIYNRKHEYKLLK